MNFIERLKVGHRFGLIGAMALVLTLAPTLLFVQAAADGMRSARLEASGTAPSKAALKLIQLTQQHRGLTSMALSGNTGALAQRGAKQIEVARAIDALSPLIGADLGTPAIEATWARARQSWKSLTGRIAKGDIDPAESFTAHTALIDELFKTTDLLSDAYGLSRDPQIDSSQLILAMLYALPALTEELGKARATGAALLTTGTASAADLQQLAVYVARARGELERMTLALDKASHANSTIKRSLGAHLQEASELTREALKLAGADIIQAAQLSAPAAPYFTQFTRAIDAHVKLNNEAMDVLETLLESRASSLSTQLYLLLAFLLALAAAAGVVGMLAARSITRQLGGEPGIVVDIASAVAEGDLGSAIPASRHNPHSIMAAMARMQAALHGIVHTVRHSAEAIATASGQIAQGNGDLASRTEKQAGALEKTAAAMEQLSTTVRQNADNAGQANALAQNASAVASKGGEIVFEVVATMKDISDSARRIADIIGVIDGIAFQTNILALNAAVEAARAGDQGRGFAVVASEVRSLAQRSAEAAKEIKQLITSSVARTERGSALVDRAGDTMKEVVASIHRVTDIMGEISSASVEQSIGVTHVGQAVTQMDQSTQQNAALVEEMAAAASSLNEQAQELVRSMSVFRVDQARLEDQALPEEHSSSAPVRRPAMALLNA
ncbi:methyl-accepting chemotaxis protein [Thauera chlorobenzoica]|uniref:Methyl-accepting chemotaxis protein n=1 Tax=Thauera chlorobenzoica TaxID=96773 RepID=A0A1H5WLC3_9RHOO|nr:methyl-accepting chemotaxis protein [Thauera chlorobenzoica]APR04378.1 Methyl-accepting chemotaxis protein [Thauera chlorobenzoica]SEG00143.1 Methyl-accepting chemotaxis protein [Thauera chlorobenzoica]